MSTIPEDEPITVAKLLWLVVRFDLVTVNVAQVAAIRSFGCSRGITSSSVAKTKVERGGGEIASPRPSTEPIKIFLGPVLKKNLFFCFVGKSNSEL